MPTLRERFGLPSRSTFPIFRPKDKYWLWIRQQAESSNKFERIGAMANAVGALELGLIASGMDPKRRKFVRATKYPHWPKLDELEDAHTARHRAVHNLRVPEPAECAKHVRTMYQAWQALRDHFVTIENAARLAKEFLSSRHVSEVFLFGSLARQFPRPCDIDLLIVDDGTFSWRWSRYGKVLVDSLLESAELSTKENRAAERCEWLDLVTVHGKLFGINRAYTGTVFRHQDDPFFFINIADGLLTFDQGSSQWVNNPPLIFKHLKQSREQLERLAVLRSQRNNRMTSPSDEEPSIAPFNFDEAYVDFDEVTGSSTTDNIEELLFTKRKEKRQRR